MHSYSSPFALGHKALESLWDGVVIATEKVDGSQCSFGLIEGHLQVRSRKTDLLTSPEGMFDKALETIHSLESVLMPGWSYRGEYLRVPHHNALRYARVPKGHIILFDVDKGDQDYLNPAELMLESMRIGLECVSTFATYYEKPSLDVLKFLLGSESILGGTKIEGLVLKNYARYAPDKKVLMGKLVADDFKEVHDKAWGAANPSQAAFVEDLAERYATEARWAKAVQHLREQGAIQGVPQDIPVVLKEISRDVHEECGEQIKEQLFKHFWNKVIARRVIRGAAEWYKQQLAEGGTDGTTRHDDAL